MVLSAQTKKGVSRPNTKSFSDETKSVLYDISDYETWQKMGDQPARECERSELI